MVKQRNGIRRLENEGLFIVEAIVDRRRVEENRLQYLIKWKDYPSSHNTWEFAANIAHCKDIIAEFRELRLSEGFVDSEEEVDKAPPPPLLPPVTQTSPTSRKRRRKRKSETSPSACQSRMSDTVDQTSQASSIIPQSNPANSTTDISMNDSSNSSTKLHHPISSLTPLIIPSPTVVPPKQNSISIASINLNNAIKIFAATFNQSGKYFCTLFSDGSKFWLSNENCRKYIPQLLIDYYENCSVFIDPMLDQQQPRSSRKDEDIMQQQPPKYSSSTEMPYHVDQSRKGGEEGERMQEEDDDHISESLRPIEFSPLPSSIFPEN